MMGLQIFLDPKGLSTFWTPQREVESSLALIVAATSKLASLPVTAKPDPATSPRLEG